MITEVKDNDIEMLAACFRLQAGFRSPGKSAKSKAKSN